MASKSKSGSRSGGKTKSSSGSGAKSDVITVRLSPKLKYGLELLSRKQHRPLSSVVTWAIEQIMTNHEAGLYKTTKSIKSGKGMDVSTEEYMFEMLWDIEPADRLVKLATHWPELMTYEEEKLIKYFKEAGSWPKKGDSATEAMQKMWPDMRIDPFDGEFVWLG